MAKGRKRKTGKRTASGRLSRAKEERVKRGQSDVRSVVMSQPHRSGFGKERQADQRAETEAGRLFMLGRITEAEYWAAERWFRLIGEFHRVIAAPVTSTTVLGTLAAGDRGDCEGDTGAAERPETEEERRDRVLGAHGAAMRALRRLVDSRAVFRVLEAVVLQGRPAGGSVEVAVLREGLIALARHWRMQAPTSGVGVLQGWQAERPGWPHDVRTVDIVVREREPARKTLDNSG